MLRVRVLSSALAIYFGEFQLRNVKRGEGENPFVVENTSIKAFKYSEVDGSTEHSYASFPLVVLFCDCH
jgi:hypothetical protein